MIFVLERAVGSVPAAMSPDKAAATKGGHFVIDDANPALGPGVPGRAELETALEYRLVPVKSRRSRRCELTRRDTPTLEVAVAEAVSALAVLSKAHPGYSRPVRRALEYIR